MLLAFTDRGARLSAERQEELAALAYPELAPAAAREKLQRVARHVLGGA